MTGQLVKFDEILGQDAAIDALTRAIRAERLPHAMIFAGPVGVGKATTARALAGWFLCEKPRETTPCEKCPSCTSFDTGNHPDFHLIYRQLVRLDKQDAKARDLAADVIRDFLIDRAAHSSVVGKGKVFLVEEADLMSTAAQNTLLKTLEEPAGRTLIILLTDQPDVLLPTIRSRCRMIRFAALDQKTVREQLIKRHVDREMASRAAELSEGSIGLALRWIEDGIIDRATDLNGRIEKIVNGKGAWELPEWFKVACEAYAERQLKRDDKTSTDQAKREGVSLYLKLAANTFRRMLATGNQDSESLERLCTAIDVVTRAEQYLESNVNIPLVLQQLTAALEQALHPQAV